MKVQARPLSLCRTNNLPEGRLQAHDASSDRVSFGQAKLAVKGKKVFWATLRQKTFGKKGSSWVRKAFGVLIFPLALLWYGVKWVLGRRDGFQEKPTPTPGQPSSPPAVEKPKQDAPPSVAPPKIALPPQPAPPDTSQPKSVPSSSGTAAKPALAPVLATQSELLQALSIPYPYTLYGQNLVVETKPLTQVLNQLRTAPSIALGDLHGSYLKLVETLAAGDLISMPVQSAKDFARLAQTLDNGLAMDPELTAASNRAIAKDLVQQLSDLIKTMRWTGGNRQLILIGDVLADRGPVDSLTLAVLEHLTQDDPNRIISLASNHDHAAFKYLVSGKYGLMFEQQDSLKRAFWLADAPEPLRTRYRVQLLKTKLMHYNPKTQTLYVHAPIQVDQVQQLITGMKQSKVLPGSFQYQDITTPTQVADFVEKANTYYRAYLQRAFTQKTLGKAEEILFNNDPTGFLWSRSTLNDPAQVPFLRRGVQVLVHGHDSRSYFSPFFIKKQHPVYQVANLDQEVRKGLEPAGSVDNTLFLG